MNFVVLSDIFERAKEAVTVPCNAQISCFTYMGGSDDSANASVQRQIIRSVEYWCLDVQSLDLENGQYIVNVADDGVGVQKKDESSAMGKSFGLTIMRERAARLNGKLTVESRPAGGTVVRLVFPQRTAPYQKSEPSA